MNSPKLNRMFAKCEMKTTEHTNIKYLRGYEKRDNICSGKGFVDKVKNEFDLSDGSHLDV